MAKNWCFTWNNYTEENEKSLQDWEEVNYIIYGHEIAPSTGTKHLQGYIQFKAKHRITWIKKKLGDTIHLEIAKGSPASNEDYCSKDEHYYERGIIKVKGSNKNELKELIEKCDTWNDVLSICKIEKHLPYAREVWNNRKPEIQEGVVLRPWQNKLFIELMKVPDDRSIVWVYDKNGGIGKTFFCKYMYTNYDAFYCSPAKGADIIHMYNNQRIILYDIPRCVDEEYVNWGVIEKLKDGIVFSGKYNSCLKYRNANAHLMVFSNNMPPLAKFSADRIKFLDCSNALVSITQGLEHWNI